MEINILIRLLDRPIISVGQDGKIVKQQVFGILNGEPIFVYYNWVDHYDGLVSTGELSVLQILATLQ